MRQKTKSKKRGPLLEKKKTAGDTVGIGNEA